MLPRLIGAALLFGTLAGSLHEAVATDRLAQLAGIRGGNRLGTSYLQRLRGVSRNPHSRQSYNSRPGYNSQAYRPQPASQQSYGSRPSYAPAPAAQVQAARPAATAPVRPAPSAPTPPAPSVAGSPTPAAPAGPAPAAVVASPTPSTPAPSTTEPATFDAPAGATLTLSHNDLGEQPGRVMLRLAAMTVRCDVLGWESTKVTFRLPEVLVEQPLAARLEVLMASGKPAVSYAVRLVAEPKVVVHEENSNATAAIPSPLVVNKYAAQDSELGLPVPAPSLPALNAVPLAN